jgi:hypothetical protein
VRYVAAVACREEEHRVITRERSEKNDGAAGKKGIGLGLDRVAGTAWFLKAGGGQGLTSHRSGGQRGAWG